MKKLGLICVAMTMLCALPASAKTLPDIYTSLYILGDSLSDNGTSDPVGTVSSDGDVWNDPLLDQFDAAGKTAVNLAYGGATAAGTRSIDLAAQVQEFIDDAGLKGDRPLVSLWFGGNDLLAGFTPANAFAAIASIDAAVDALVTQGVSDFLVFGLPDLGKIPGTVLNPDLTDDDRDDITELSSFFNATLQATLPTAPTISYVDVFTLTAETAARPGDFGFSTLFPCTLSPFVDCADTPFWDLIHPTSAAHAFIEDAARAALPPVPLPAGGWLLLTGLAAAAGLKRRKAIAA